MKKSKYKYLRVMQQLVDGQWSDIIAIEKNDTPEEKRQFSADVKAYRKNEPYPIRIIERRMPADELFHV